MPQEKTAQEAKICPIWSPCFRAPKKNISFRSTPMENCDWIIKQIKKQILDFSLKEGLVTMGQVLGDHTRFFFGGGEGQRPPCASPPPWPSIFPIILFWGPPPCYPGWPATPCTSNGLWLLSRMAGPDEFVKKVPKVQPNSFL
jgi:hypothetical protein